MRLPAVLLAGVLVGSCGGVRAAEPRRLAVIIHPSQRLERLDLRDLRAYFLKQVRYWPDGTPVRPVLRTEDSPQFGAFLRDVLGGWSPARYGEYWIQKKLAAGEVQPLRLESDERLIDLVALLKGAIGLVFRSSLAGREAKVRVVEVAP